MEELNFQSYHKIILKYPVLNKNYKIYKFTRKQWPIHRKKKNDNLTEMITEEAQTLELFIKDVKSTVLNMYNELKETAVFPRE